MMEWRSENTGEPFDPYANVLLCDACGQEVEPREAVENDHMHEKCFKEWCEKVVEDFDPVP
jgi:hypothetical protein